MPDSRKVQLTDTMFGTYHESTERQVDGGAAKRSTMTVEDEGNPQTYIFAPKPNVLGWTQNLSDCRTYVATYESLRSNNEFKEYFPAEKTIDVVLQGSNSRVIRGVAYEHFEKDKKEPERKYYDALEAEDAASGKESSFWGNVEGWVGAPNSEGAEIGCVADLPTVSSQKDAPQHSSER